MACILFLQMETISDLSTLVFIRDLEETMHVLMRLYVGKGGIRSKARSPGHGQKVCLLVKRWTTVVLESTDHLTARGMGNRSGSR